MATIYQSPNLLIHHQIFIYTITNYVVIVKLNGKSPNLIIYKSPNLFSEHQ